MTFWLCADCGVLVQGDPKAAHEHHHESGAWDHWMFEVKVEKWRRGFTGRSIHTSDYGGFYIDDHETPVEAATHVAIKTFNEKWHEIGAPS